MVMMDPLGDMLARIRNAQMRNKSVVSSPSSKLKLNVLDVLKREGFIRDFQQKEIQKGIHEVEIELKYHNGEPVIQNMKRVSRPGRRVYSGIKTLNRVSNGLGISILSTPSGVLSDEEARKANVGGEVLCTVL